jgi:hypothetical protein
MDRTPATWKRVFSLQLEINQVGLMPRSYIDSSQATQLSPSNACVFFNTVCLRPSNISSSLQSCPTEQQGNPTQQRQRCPNRCRGLAHTAPHPRHRDNRCEDRDYGQGTINNIQRLRDTATHKPVPTRSRAPCRLRLRSGITRTRTCY